MVVDGVFEAGTGGELPVRFHETPALSAKQLTDIQRNIRRRLLRALTRRGLLEAEVAEEMDSWDHGGGFSLDAGVHIEADDRSGLERLLRYCARPVFALERLRQIDPEHLVYERLKPGPGGSVSLLLTPLELIDRLAALIPPPRRHRHRYYGVLAPNAPLRAAVTALAGAKDKAPLPSAMTEAAPAPESSATVPNAPDEEAEEPAHRKAARYVWALLLARIFGAGRAVRRQRCRDRAVPRWPDCRRSQADRRQKPLARLPVPPSRPPHRLAVAESGLQHNGGGVAIQPDPGFVGTLQAAPEIVAGSGRRRGAAGEMRDGEKGGRFFGSVGGMREASPSDLRQWTATPRFAQISVCIYSYSSRSPDQDAHARRSRRVCHFAHHHLSSPPARTHRALPHRAVSPGHLARTGAG